MKKFFIIISLTLIFSLILPNFVQAAEAFNVYPIFYLPRQIEILSSDGSVQQTDENLTMLPANLNEQSLHIVSNYYGENNGVRYGVNFPINFTNDQLNLQEIDTNNFYLMNFEFEIYPLSFKEHSDTVVSTRINNIVRNMGSSDEAIYYPAGSGLESVSRYQPNGDMSLFYQTTYIENPELVDYAYGCYTFHITMIIRLNISTTLKSLFFDISLSHLFENIDEAIINIHPATTTKLVLSDLDDVNSSITELNKNITEIYKLISKIESNGSATSLNHMLHYTTQSYGELIDLNHHLQEEMQILRDSMPESVQSGVSDAMDEQKDKWQSEALEGLDSAVKDIQEKLNIDISAIQSAFQNLYDSITTHDTDAVLTLPAGTVTVGEQQYTFWEETDIDFSIYFDYPIIQTLLVPLRFVIIIGFGYFMLGQVKKIESIVTMSSGGE